MLVNISFILGCLIVMFIPIVISFVFNITVVLSREYFTLSVYGFYMIFYMMIQMLFSYLNRRRVRNTHSRNPSITGKYNVLAVGYREDPELFKNCLTSITNLTSMENIHKVYIVIDGNKQDDLYMGDIAKDTISAEVILAERKLSDEEDYYTDKELNEKIYCILQPHSGKRHALYTGLKLSCNDDVDGVLCTDSDTELHPDSLFYLANLLESDDNYGAVTGNVKISNYKSSIVSYLSYLRYWFACNLERGYQSYNNCVLCVSGPLGIYRVEFLRTFLETWLNQRFLNQECTYGDDRHLTNNMLLLGKKIGYTHLASCITDTPENIQKFFNQQVRWCKSSFREFLWNIRCLSKHSLWMTVDLIYQTVYSFIVLGSLIYILYFGSVFQFMIYMSTLLGFNLLKGVYASVIEKSTRYLLFTFYGLAYISVLAPAKLYAGLTMRDVDWGTSSRKFKMSNFEAKHIFLLVWNLGITSGIVYSFVRNVYNNDDFIAIGCVFGYIAVVGLLLVFKF